MKFILSRTSVWGDTSKPLSKLAKIETLNLTYMDSRNAKTLEEAKKKPWYKSWFEQGTNHREENGLVVCDRLHQETPCNTIEVNSLEDILGLVNEEGEIVVTKTNYKEISYEIEIYDGYRE